METENQKLLNSSKHRMNEESKAYLEPVKQLEAAARLEKQRESAYKNKRFDLKYEVGFCVKMST